MSELSLDDFNDLNALWHNYCQQVLDNYKIKTAAYGKEISLPSANLIDGNIWLEIGLCITRLMRKNIWSTNFCLFMFQKGIKGIPEGENYKQGLNQLEEVLFSKGLTSRRLCYE